MRKGMQFGRLANSSYGWRIPQHVPDLQRRNIRHTSTFLPSTLTFQEIDAKWQKIWAEKPIRRNAVNSTAKPKSYILSMFPYPSGSLHMGHLRVYTISDILARYKRMRGYNVLHPMGWDAFGLPAENAAIERGIDPALWTDDNISKMKEQLRGMNAQFDWGQEFRTCSPSFYKHTQKIFLMLHRRGLAYQQEAMVNYDPVDKTVLANEQVDSNGRAWRSGAIVQQLKLKQWFFRVTAFKEALLRDLDDLTKHGNWPERVVLQQRHWLGKSTGANIYFQVDALQRSGRFTKVVKVFTTRPDTLFGVTYIALSLSHPLVQQAATESPELQRFLDHAKELPRDSKAGFLIPDFVAKNPKSSLPDCSDSMTDSLPVYVAPYVLDDYGEGAVMGVPGHDSRDLAFWQAHNPSGTVPIVVTPSHKARPADLVPQAKSLQVAFTDRGQLTELCGPYASIASEEAGKRIVSALEKASQEAEPAEQWHLRDWLVSRQRYWGTPIPIIHCPSCGSVPVPEDQLPVELPPLESSMLGRPGNPLDLISSWVNTPCPECHRPAKRDTDTMDTFVDSSWYFMRFPDAHNAHEPFSRESARSMLPVDTYIGGVEHAILHLLYARFVYKFLASERLVPQLTGKEAFPAEPFRQLVTQGMVHGKTFSDPGTGRFLRAMEVEGADTTSPFIRASRMKPAITWEKMSKSKHNGVDPIHCISNYGADATRAHILFSAPVSEVLDWDEEKIVGIQRWFHRISRLVSVCRSAVSSSSLYPADLTASKGMLKEYPAEDVVDSLQDGEVDVFLLIHNTIDSVTRTFEKNAYALNTTISDLIKLTNSLHEFGLVGQSTKRPHEVLNQPSTINASIPYYGLTVLLRMLAPIAPGFAEESWERLHLHLLKESLPVPSIFEGAWPESVMDLDLSSKLMKRRKTLTCAVQINGKLKFTISLPKFQGMNDNGKPVDNAQDSATDEFLIRSLLDTDEGKYWLRERNDWEKRKRVIVVQGGKLVNIVF